MLRRRELLALARTGASARLSELQREMTEIYAAFPDLRRGRRRQPARLARRARTARRRRGWTAAQRKAVSERMRKYWAHRKAGKK
jgi:hypothetical protein